MVAISPIGGLAALSSPGLSAALPVDAATAVQLPGLVQNVQSLL